MKSIAILLALAPLASCGVQSSDSETKIVGGKPVKASSDIAKQTVSLVEPGDNMAFCTGTLIGKRHVITAAHCLVDLPFTPAVGFGLRATTSTIIEVKLAKPHKDYSSDHPEGDDATSPINDIGLIELKEDAPGYAQVANVLTDANAVVTGEELVLAGFGVTDGRRGTGSGTLRTVSTKISNLSDARREIDFGGAPGRSACSGDSGGPAFVKRDGKLALVGVTSRGSFICDEEGIYTDIRYFQTWISDTKSDFAKL